MHASTLLFLSLASMLHLPFLTLAALPDMYLGTVDTCSPARYNIQYAAWLVSSQACKKDGDSSALTLIGAYPVTSAGCGLEPPTTVGGYENITFTGCGGPGSPYPTAVLQNGIEELKCAPVKKEKKDRFCSGFFCANVNRTGVLKTLYRCRGTEESEEDDS